MEPDNNIRTAQERIMAVFSRKPAAAQTTESARATLSEGLRCVVQEGDTQTVMDMPAGIGGSGTAAKPGVFARATVAGCVAIGVKLTAAREGVTLRSITVDITMDFDDSALFGMGTASAAPLDTRLTIRLDSDANEDQLASLVDQALSCDPYFLALRDAQSVQTQIEKM